MQNLRTSVSFVALLLCLIIQAQPVTKIEVQLDVSKKERIAVKVFPPEQKSDWRYVIPEIIPGTYMKINYERFYDKIRAVDVEGNKMKVKKKDNVFLISGDQPLDYMTYEVEQSQGDWKIWDRILACAGTVFTEDGYLLNFQLISGYFEDFKDLPYEVEFLKKKDLFAATSMNATLRSAEKDVFRTNNYFELIDQPILYSEPDTTSFQINNNRFKIAVHSETEKVKAEMLKPRLTKIMHAIDSFSGFTSEEDYHFIFYYVNKDRLKGVLKTFGMGSALEHNQSSIYYFNEAVWDSTFSNLDWIGAHEYFHTITPLSLHSEKIHDFNFETPDMSKHGWLYEGVTDYFAALLSAQYDLSNSITFNMKWAVYTAEKQKPRSFTESSQNIIKKNMFSWIGKIGQLGNFYERGKLVAMAMDVEIFENSEGEKRLIDVMLEMRKDFEGSYFPDDQLRDLLVKYSYPEIGEIYDKYVEGNEVVPYEKYFSKLGWKYYPKGSKRPSFGRFGIFYDDENQKYYLKTVKKNIIGFQKGDTLKTVNGVDATRENALEEHFFSYIFYPEENKELTIEVLRNGELIKLAEKPAEEKIKFPQIVVQKEFTEEQELFRKDFYEQE
ncbi:hypothetical protein [Ekhidna sp.]|uniref:M61 family metallopeptidase n=1 Tax=Ekhidna sp. TaxID=2608089 RepID=UPI003CCBC4C5